MIETIERATTLVQQVIAAIRREVETGVFAAGSRLPSEQALAAHLGVSRPVLREAMSQLKADAVLTTRKGSGAYVAGNPAGNAFRLPSGEPLSTSLQHLFELRFWAEIAVAEMAALRAKRSDLKRMAEALEIMHEHSNDFEIASRADVDLHRAIGQASQNPYFVSFISFIEAQLLHTRAIAWENAAHLAGGSSVAQAEHRLLFEAIKSGNALASRQAARAHLLAAAQRMQVDVSGLARLG